jgi:putative copper resistance protein D
VGRGGYLAAVILHVLAAVIWLGGAFFFALVGAPVLRRVNPPELRRALFDALGRRFRVVGWSAVAVLLASGTALVHGRGWTSAALDGSLWSTPGGRMLAWKLAAVAGMVVATAVHDFSLGPRAAVAGPDAESLRRRSARWARAGALLGLLALVAAVRLARGL